MTESAGCTQQDQKYNILLIITDGQITDMQQTIDQIVYGTELPLSIIIVGVGKADFSAMDELDADEVPLFSKRYNKKMAADIVQFVPFREFQNNPMMLAKETLEEVPGQMLDFFRRRGITPNPATEAQKRALQSKLSQQKSLGGNQEENKEDFWAQKKEEFLQRMQAKGHDLFAVQDYLSKNGYPYLDDNIYLKNKANKSYKNAIFVPKEEEP